MRKWNSLFITLLYIFLMAGFIPATDGYAQKSVPNQEILNNIKILESVLDRLISPGSSKVRFFGSNTRGYYLMNYGVMFNVNYSLLNPTIFSFKLSKKIKNRKGDVFEYLSHDGEEQRYDKNFDDEMEKLKTSITKFLSDWTGALTGLKSVEHVTVVVDFNGLMSKFVDAMDGGVHQLIASVPMREIINYRKGRINYDQFKAKIDFEEIASIDEDISILSNVIQTSLKHTGRKNKIGKVDDVRGLYFKGYGVIFLTDISLGIGSGAYSKVFTILESKKRSISFESMVDTSENIEKQVKKIEQKLIQLISNYGQNIKKLQPDEWFEISLNYEGIPAREKFSKTTLKVQKKYIDDYVKERIKFNEFKKKVRVINY